MPFRRPGCPERPTLDHYRHVLGASNVPRYFLNSLIISVGSTLVALSLAIFAAYGFARFRFRGRRAGLAFILVGPAPADGGDHRAAVRDAAVSRFGQHLPGIDPRLPDPDAAA